MNENMTLIDLVNMYPNKPWSYYGLSENPNITIDIINNNIDKPWNYIYLSINPPMRFLYFLRDDSNISNFFNCAIPIAP